MENLIQYNDDDSVNVPFGRVAEWYISNHPLLKNIRPKCQSRKNTSELVNKNIITVSRVEGAVDYIEWNTKNGCTKSTNRIDDIIELTPEGDEYVRQIEAGEKKDKSCWYWKMYCSGEGNSCQHECGGIGRCKEDCANYSLPNNLKNHHDMHLCKVRVISESKLSWLKKEKPLRIKIEGSHLPVNTLISHVPNNTRLNLSCQISDNIIISRRANHKTAKDIKAKLLASYNNASENELREALLKNQKTICNDIKLRSFIMYNDRRLKENTGLWTILHYMILELLKPKRFVLYYQQPDTTKPESSSEHYYQLTLSHDFWLKNGKNFGQFCIGIDGKYDLNNDKAPILTFVIENNAGAGTPLAFGLSNRENSLSIQLAVLAIKNNIPCDDDNCSHEWFYEDLPNNKGFQRVLKCNKNLQTWKSFAMIDKSRPTKSAIKDILRGTFLCWFHIMQTLGENLNQWSIPWNIRYPIAIAFKIIGRSRTEEQAIELGNLYKSFIDKLSLSVKKKNKLKNDLFKNWICDEWRLSLIDARRIPNNTTQHPMITNNFTERLHHTIETKYNGIQTVVNFVERLYGMKLKRENIGENTGETYFEAGLVTLFNMQSIEQKNQSAILPTDKLRRLNQGRLYYLLGLVEPSQHPDYFYVKKINNHHLLESAYDGKLIELDDSVMNFLIPFYDKLLESHINIIPYREGYYLTNISTGECLICYDYIWNGPFRDVCKHNHAAKIYHQSQINNSLYQQEVKADLVNYFKNKHKVLPAEKKNELIYNGDVEIAFNEIVKIFEIQGGAIFQANRIKSDVNNDPFRPITPNNHETSSFGVPPKLTAKP